MSRHVMFTLSLPAILPLLAISGCFTAADDCEPGSKIACICSDDTPGARTCDTGGTYSACACDPGDGGTPDAGGAACPSGWDLCDGACVDVLDDPLNCGACTTACATGEVCNGGSCVSGGDCRQTPCIGITFCDETTGLCMPGCSQNDHCPPGEFCDLGTHSCQCIPDSERCGPTCTDTQSDPSNCGLCEKTCPATAACDLGACACPAGQSECSGVCVDTSLDPLNCGGCEKTCDARATCSGGACLCPGSETECDGVCVDTASDPLHCNGCNVPCAAGETCDNGSCTPPPDCRVDGCTGLSWCDTTTGTCRPGCDSDARCRPDQACDLAAHACVCTTGTSECAGGCVNTDSNASHCGGCNLPCPTGQACAGGSCIDPSLACVTYDAGNRLTACQNGGECTGDMECAIVGFAGTCLDETPCGAIPAGPCCGAGEFCGTTTGGILPGQSNFCCVPGETLPDGLFGSPCADAGLDIACVSDADCPKAWGKGYCNVSASPPVCGECTQDSHCSGQRCDLPTGTCVDCLGPGDCPPSKPVCQTSTHVCSVCASDRDCSAPKPACDAGGGACVACTENVHCSAPLSLCDSSTNSCVECLADGDCPSSKPVCDQNACVICPSGTSCQTMKSGRRACYATPFISLCQQDSECQIFTPGTICDEPASGGGLACSYPCP